MLSQVTEMLGNTMQNIIQLTLSQVLSGAIVLALLIGIIQYLLAIWIKIRLEKSIQHEYDKKLEQYRFQQLQRQKAETIARLFSKWIKYRGKESVYLNKKELIDFYEELNQMSFEISLWIKDKELLGDIMECLQLKSGSKDIRTLVGRIRKVILDNNEVFDEQKITLWPNSEIEKKLFRK